MTYWPDTAMIMAAGRGVRMRPLTDTIPKPLVPVAGRTMLDRAIDRLVAAQVSRIVINVQYLGDLIRQQVARRDDADFIIIDEGDTALETGGGVVNALPNLGQKPFFVVNADSVWVDGPVPMLARLTSAWQARHDIAPCTAMLLLHRSEQARGDAPGRDFWLDQAGVPARPVPDGGQAYTYAGVQLASPDLFRDPPGRQFSTNILWNRAAQSGQLAAMVHDGLWFHIGTPEGLNRAEADFAVLERLKPDAAAHHVPEAASDYCAIS